jgi:hypothetical protein
VGTGLPQIVSAIFSLAKGAIQQHAYHILAQLKDCVLSANIVDFLGTDPADVDLPSREAVFAAIGHGGGEVRAQLHQDALC